MLVDEKIIARFNELEKRASEINVISRGETQKSIKISDWDGFITNVLSLFSYVFSEQSIHYYKIKKINDDFNGWAYFVDRALAVLKAGHDDYINGFYSDLQKQVIGELLGDFLILSKKALADGYVYVSAVLASAALEDSLKKYAIVNGVENISDKDMSEVINSLKAKGLVSGAQKSLLDVMPKIRNYAMHANWEKITKEDVGSIIGFLEQFLISKY